MSEHQTCPECDGTGEIPTKRVVIVPNEYRIGVHVKTTNLINFQVTYQKFKAALADVGYEVMDIESLECVTDEIQDCFDKE